MNIFDQFLATQGRMTANDTAQLDNKMTLAKLDQLKRSNDMQGKTLAYYANQQKTPTTTLANLSEMAQTDQPDASLESQGLRAEKAVPAPKLPTPSEAILTSAAEADKRGREMQAINPAESARLFKERDDLYLKAAPILKEERLGKIEESNQVNQYMGAVKDDASLNGVMAMMQKSHPEIAQAWANMKLPNGAPAFPRNLDGSFAYTPQTTKIVEAVANASMKRAEQLKAENDIADNKRADIEQTRKAEADKETVRNNKEKTAVAREGNAVKATAAASKPDPSATMSDDAKDAAAARYNIDGTLPPNMGRGVQGAVLTADILSRAAKIAKDSGDTPEATRIGQLANKANSQALGQITKQEQMVGAFEKNALRNADIALATSAKADRTGSPVLNRWLLAGQKEIAGDVDVAKFNQATNTFVNEYAKIMSGSMGNTVVSDSMRKEQMDVLATKNTPEQFQAVVDQMKLEMKNRMKGFADQKAELTGSMKGKSATKTDSGFVEGQIYADANGNKAKYVKGQWVPQ